MATGKDEIKGILDNLITVLELPEEQSWQDLINAAKENRSLVVCVDECL